MYGTAERMNGRTRLHRYREGIPVNNGTRIEELLVRIGSRGRDKMCRHQLNEWALEERRKDEVEIPAMQTILIHEW